MIHGSSTLASVRRRDPVSGSNLSVAQAQRPTSATPILQMLLAEVTSLRQQVNTLTVRQPRTLQQVEPIDDEDDLEPAGAIEPGTLTQIFD